ncbi:MAG TPA: IS630 family transposase [Phycisphaerae bacterium]|nr:IS630 family transposase [Phycisphaerae bacterium]
MDRVEARRPNPYERQKLQHMKRQCTNAVNSRHARVILLSGGGVSNAEIAWRVGYSDVWVRQIIRRFNDGGVPAISWYPYYCAHGEPRKFFAEIVEQVVEVALSSPKALIGMNGWSLAKLRAYLIEQKIIGSISLSWLRAILRQRKVRWRHSKTWKESTDPEFWPKYRAVRRLYKHPSRNGRVICVDEFGPLNLQPRGGLCLTGPSRRVERHRATYNRCGGVRHMFGAYDLKTDRLFGIFTRQKNWVEFLSFLRWLRRRYRSGEILYIVLDNASFHLKAEVRAWAAEHRIRFYFTPSSASWLNRIECHFTALRNFALNNSDFRTHEEQQEAIESYLDWRNGTRDISLKTWTSYKRQHRVTRHAA